MENKSLGLKDIELNGFIGNNYWVLNTLFPIASCEELKLAFEKALYEWAKSKKIKENIIDRFNNYCNQRGKKSIKSSFHSARTEVVNGKWYYYGTNIQITSIWGSALDASQFLWMFGEMGKHLLSLNSAIKNSEEDRLTILFLLGFTYKEIAKKENIPVKLLQEFSILLGKDLANAGHRHASTISNFEKWLHQQLPKDYPAVCFVFNDWITIGKELDIYIPSLQLAFELNGPGHYKPIYSEESFKRSQIVDKLKNKLCKEEGIELLTINVSDIKNKYLEKSSMHHYDFIKKSINSKISGETIIYPEKEEIIQSVIRKPSKKDKEVLFSELTKGIERKEDPRQYPDSTFYFRDSKIIFEHYKIKGSNEEEQLWCSPVFWLEFRAQFNMKHGEIVSLVKTMLKKYFKLTGIEPSPLRDDRLQRWKRIEKRTAYSDKEHLPDTEKLFLELIPNLSKREDRTKYPNSTFYYKTNNKGKRLIFEYDEKSENLLCSRTLFWSKFESQFLMNREEISAFVTTMARKYLGVKDCSPHGDFLLSSKNKVVSIDDRIAAAEKHFSVGKTQMSRQ